MIDHWYVPDAPEEKRPIMAPTNVEAPFDAAVLELVCHYCELTCANSACTLLFRSNIVAAVAASDQYASCTSAVIVLT